MVENSMINPPVSDVPSSHRAGDMGARWARHQKGGAEWSAPGSIQREGRLALSRSMATHSTFSVSCVPEPGTDFTENDEPGHVAPVGSTPNTV
jgi:hypothetical protein